MRRGGSPRPHKASPLIVTTFVFFAVFLPLQEVQDIAPDQFLRVTGIEQVDVREVQRLLLGWVEANDVVRNVLAAQPLHPFSDIMWI